MQTRKNSTAWMISSMVFEARAEDSDWTPVNTTRWLALLYTTYFSITTESVSADPAHCRSYFFSSHVRAPAAYPSTATCNVGMITG